MAVDAKWWCLPWHSFLLSVECFCSSVFGHDYKEFVTVTNFFSGKGLVRDLRVRNPHRMKGIMWIGNQKKQSENGLAIPSLPSVHVCCFMMYGMQRMVVNTSPDQNFWAGSTPKSARHALAVAWVYPSLSRWASTAYWLRKQTIYLLFFVDSQHKTFIWISSCWLLLVVFPDYEALIGNITNHSYEHNFNINCALLTTIIDD